MSNRLFRRPGGNANKNEEENGLNNNQVEDKHKTVKKRGEDKPLDKPDFSERKANLTPLEYRVTQQRETER